MTSEEFEIAGYARRSVMGIIKDIPHNQLETQLEILECVIRYLKGRGDSEVLVKAFQDEWMQIKIRLVPEYFKTCPRCGKITR